MFQTGFQDRQDELTAVGRPRDAFRYVGDVGKLRHIDTFIYICINPIFIALPISVAVFFTSNFPGRLLRCVFKVGILIKSFSDSSEVRDHCDLIRNNFIGLGGSIIIFKKLKFVRIFRTDDFTLSIYIRFLIDLSQV
jgi:hypothetical protein